MLFLRIASVVEALSLTVLLTNVFTVHLKPITTFGGPVHGMSYLAVVAAAALISSGARWRAFVPGIGGLLALHHLRTRKD